MVGLHLRQRVVDAVGRRGEVEELRAVEVEELLRVFLIESWRQHLLRRGAVFAGPVVEPARLAAEVHQAAVGGDARAAEKDGVTGLREHFLQLAAFALRYFIHV